MKKKKSKKLPPTPPPCRIYTEGGRVKPPREPREIAWARRDEFIKSLLSLTI